MKKIFMLCFLSGLLMAQDALTESLTKGFIQGSKESTVLPQAILNGFMDGLRISVQTDLLSLAILNGFEEGLNNSIKEK